MSKDSKYCPYCGSLVEAGVQFCGNCGASLAGAPSSTPTQPISTPPPQTYGATQPYAQPTIVTTTVVQQPSQQYSSLTTMSLVFGLLGFCCLPLVFGIAAIICGHIAKSKGANGKATAGLILGYINLAFFIVIIVLNFTLGWW